MFPVRIGFSRGKKPLREHEQEAGVPVVGSRGVLVEVLHGAPPSPMYSCEDQFAKSLET